MKNQQNQINLSTHICTLDAKIQYKISEQLKQQGFFEDDIQLALNSRLRDIEDNINIMEVFA